MLGSINTFVHPVYKYYLHDLYVGGVIVRPEGLKIVRRDFPERHKDCQRKAKPSLIPSECLDSVQEIVKEPLSSTFKPLL